MHTNMMNYLGKTILALAAALPFLLAGCGQGGSVSSHSSGTNPKADSPQAKAPDDTDKAKEEADIKAARAELSAEDRSLVEAQDFCPVMTNNRLGCMGEPIKVMVNDQPVFLCCKGCGRKALADPDKTLAKVAASKAKTKDRQKTDKGSP